MTVSQYLDKLSSRLKTGISTEHTFRGDLQTYIEELIPNIKVTNEPKRTPSGAPDYIITRKNIPVGYFEAKDIKADLKNKNYKEQFDRYKDYLDNLCFTNYIEFHFYKFGKEGPSVSIAKLQGGKIIPIPENFEKFENLLKDFCSYIGQTIKSAQKLSEMMAGKARLLANVIESALTSDEKTDADSTLLEQMTAFKEILIHDIKAKEFADIYAQTVAYGMFAARLHDNSLDNFSRTEAAELIPKSNPFLRKLFGYIAGPDIDERIKWIVDALADIFRATDLKDLLKDFGKATAQSDPMIHFYETFLAEYDAKLRKARGVWYTPEPVVNFIVRAVDDILKTEFNLPEGLADRSKVKIKVNEQDKKVEREFHKVQILDPATGTGTFLAEVIKQVYKKFEGQQGVWSNYVEEHLIPRLNGFELLMASYAMAHLKLDLLLTETGYKPKESKTQQRLRVYLTNSLEEHHPDTGTLWVNWLSTEANEANHIKRDTPVMVVMGNPPYSGISSNNGEWISQLMKEYKFTDGISIKEKKTWLNDDYVKFIRYGQHFIEKNGEGVLAFITNHKFLENPTFKGMRWNLLKAFDKIYIVNLHGASNEVCPDGSPDKNVFDIKAGVSINLFIKTGRKSKTKLAEIEYKDIWGTREDKYKTLLENSLTTFSYKKVNYEEPFYFFQPKNNKSKKSYDEGFKINDLFSLNGVGIVTARDKFCTDDNLPDLKERINDFANKLIPDSEIISKYGLKDTSSFKLTKARSNIYKEKDLNIYYQRISYRPFDEKWIFHNNDVVERPIMKVMQHFLKGENVSLNWIRPVGSTYEFDIFISKNIADQCSAGNKSAGAGISNLGPLYLYNDEGAQSSLYYSIERTPNLNPEIVKQVAEKLGLKFTNEKENKKNTFAPIDILDYIYAVLHSPTYREKYKEFLKIDFPRVPYPKDEKTFWELVKLGSELREIHLLESKAVNKFITTFPIDGNNEVVKIRYERSEAGASERGDIGKVWINETQYFAQVPQTAWEFFIGGYQPAQKWLKDRKERKLNFDDIEHYQKIIVALSETDRIMKVIDKVKVE